MKKLGYLIVFVFPPAVVAGGLLGGPATLLGVAISFLLIPVVDALVGLDLDNPDPEQREALESSLYYRAVPLAWVVTQVGLLAWVLWWVARGTLSPAETVAWALSVGAVTGGVGITVAHELGHKRTTAERAGAHVLLATVSYLHFIIEHNRGHHVRVATPEDPATARRGQSFWAFFFGTVFKQWRSAWSLENARLRKRGRTVVSARNAMIWYSVVALALPVAVGSALGWVAAAFFAAQSIIAIFLLEAVNYIEHYGLERRQLAPGKYEKTTTQHSWNASFLITNFVLFGLQRHADHHAHGGRRYPVLRHFDDSPQLPAGYPTMILAAMVPPLWRRIMEPRLDAWQAERAAAVAAATR